MATFQRTFTGKDTGVTLPSSDKLYQSQKDMNSLILEADKMKLDAFQKNQDWFLKTTTVDPIAYISTANTETQAKLLDEYNKKATAIYKASGGNPTTEDKLELVKGRQFIESEQARMSGDLEKYQLALKTIQANPDKYSLDKFQKAMVDPEDGYFVKGKYNDMVLPLMPKSPEVFFGKSANKVSGTPTTTPTKFRTSPAGVQEQMDMTFSGSDEETKRHIVANILNDPQLLEGAYEDFDKLSAKDKMVYLSDYDTDNSGTISEEEQQNIPSLTSKSEDNPILRFAQDRYLPIAKGISDTAWKPSPKPSATSTTKKYKVGEKYVAVNPGEKRVGAVPISNKTYSDPIEFDGTYKISYVPTANATELSGTSTFDITDKTNVEGFLKLYDPEKDVFVFATTGSDPDIDSGILIEVPAKDLRPSDISGLPVIVDGKETTIEQARANRKAPIAKPKVNIGL
jgi:hypothetical protein